MTILFWTSLRRSYFGIHQHLTAHTNPKHNNVQIDILVIDTRGLLTITDDQVLTLRDLQQAHPKGSFLFIADIDLPYGYRTSFKEIWSNSCDWR